MNGGCQHTRKGLENRMRINTINGNSYLNNTIFSDTMNTPLQGVLFCVQYIALIRKDRKLAITLIQQSGFDKDGFVYEQKRSKNDNEIMLEIINDSFD